MLLVLPVLLPLIQLFPVVSCGREIFLDYNCIYLSSRGPIFPQKFSPDHCIRQQLSYWDGGCVVHKLLCRMLKVKDQFLMKLIVG